jgi:hypothetical protein
MINPEYLRRNLLVCKAVGANANAKAALGRLKLQKSPPRWLMDSLQGIIDRTEELGPALACYRAVVPERVTEPQEAPK